MCSWISPISDGIVALAAILGAGSAVFGLRTWRSQLRGTAHFECARRLMLSVYGVQTAVQSLRVPMMFASEMGPALSGCTAAIVDQLQNLTAKSKIDPSVEATLAAYDKRWLAVAEARSHYKTQLLEAKIYWPDDLTKASARLLELVHEVWVDLYTHRQVLACEWDPHELGQETMRRVNETLYNSGDGDKFTQRLDAAIQMFETNLRDKLRK